MNPIPDKESLKKLPVFFIVGRERSGTTLLRTLFDAHPNVNIQVEFHFIWHMFYKYRRKLLWSKADLEKFYGELLLLPRFHLLTIDTEYLHNALLSLEGKADYSLICKMVLTCYQSFFPKERLMVLGDKCPVYSVYLSRILSAFPDAKVIHLTRDYRDNILSMLRVKIEAHLFASLAYRWKYYNNCVMKARAKFPASVRSLRYEDLVADPEKHMTELCEWVGVPYEPSILNFYTSKDDYMRVYPKRVFETGVHVNLFKPISADHTYGWKKKMPVAKVKLADSIVGRSAEQWGYERRFPSRNYWLLMLHWPQLAFGRLYYYWGELVSRLPLKLKISVMRLLARIYKKSWVKIDVQKRMNESA
jgi:hypothetical protein